MGVPPKDPTPWASEHPVVVGRTDASMLGVGGNRSQVSLQAPVEPTVQEKGIGALAVLCTRDDVKCPEEVSSAPVQPMGIGAYHPCNDVSVQENIPSAPVEPLKHRCKASVQPMVPASAVRSP